MGCVMILSDRELRERLERGDFVVDPIQSLEVQLQPASIDLRLDRRFLVFRASRVACIEPTDMPADLTEEISVGDDEGFILHPGVFVLGTTVERVRIPTDLVGRVEGRSSLGRLAVVVHATAGFIDPGFEGQITLELTNLGRCAVRLHPGMRICQIVLHQMTSAAERPSGPARGSKYHGQSGPVASRIGVDIKR